MYLLKCLKFVKQIKRCACENDMLKISENCRKEENIKTQDIKKINMEFTVKFWIFSN